MRKKIFLVVIVASIMVALFYASAVPLQAQSSGAAGLAGQVSSKEEGAMEGVLVTAKHDGSTMSTTVVSDAKGHYSFPADRMQPGQYSLRIRAVGYDLDTPGQVEVVAGKPTQLDLKLVKAKDMAAQLSNTEWIMSMPGTRQQKTPLYQCSMCHSLLRVVRNTKDADEWEATIRRMNYFIGSTPLKPQRRPTPPPDQAAAEAERRRQSHDALVARYVAGGGVMPKEAPQASGGDGMGGPGMDGEGADPGGPARRRLAEFLASVNLSQGPNLPYELKTLPRPKGRATHVIYTTYELPRKATAVHDCAIGPDGLIWYTDFVAQYYGTLDPKTGQVVEHTVPVLKPGYPTGLMDVRFDKAGNTWMSMMAQGGIAKVDKETQKLVVYNVTPNEDIPSIQIPMIMPNYSDVDGKVWTNNIGLGGIDRLDIKTGQIEAIDPFRTWSKDLRNQGTYGINADAQNNLYVNDINTDMIVRIDAKTLESKFYVTPTPDSGPRRGRMDSQFHLWFAENRVDKIGMLDPETGRIVEYPLDTPFTQAYDVARDKFGDVWGGGMTSDIIFRFNPDSKQYVDYLLPKLDYNVRRVDVDSSKKPATFWVGDDHSAIITRIEPLD